MVSFCEHLGTNINVWFDEPGLPLVAEPHLSGHHQGSVAINAILIMATLGEDVPVTAVNMPQQQQQQQQPLPREILQHNVSRQAVVTPLGGYPAQRQKADLNSLEKAQQGDVTANMSHWQNGDEANGFEADDQEDGPEREGREQQDDPDPEQLPA